MSSKNELNLENIDMNDVKKLCESMLNKYGKDKQLIQTIQELSELIQAITKLFQKGYNNETIYGDNGIFEECSDVWLMLQQIETLFDKNDVWIFYKKKCINDAWWKLR